MNWKDYIHSNPAILQGKPIIRGIRISVELILGRLADGWTDAVIFDSYQTLPPAASQAIHAFLLDTIRDDVFYPLPVSEAL